MQETEVLSRGDNFLVVNEPQESRVTDGYIADENIVSEFLTDDIIDLIDSSIKKLAKLSFASYDENGVCVFELSSVEDITISRLLQLRETAIAVRRSHAIIVKRHNKAVLSLYDGVMILRECDIKRCAEENIPFTLVFGDDRYILKPVSCKNIIEVNKHICILELLDDEDSLPERIDFGLKISCIDDIARVAKKARKIIKTRRREIPLVRWMGAYARNGKSLYESVKWELDNSRGYSSREVAAALAYPDTKVGGGLIGLLVNKKSCSQIRYSTDGDGYTHLCGDGRTLRPTAWNTVAKKWVESYRYTRTRSCGDRFDYDEVVGVFDYLGIVVHKTANKKTRRMAMRVAEQLGFPYYGTLTHATEEIAYKNREQSRIIVCADET